jgi:hypothetical protein
MGKYDVATGEYTADVYLDMKCSENCSNMDFEFMNGRAESTDLSIDTPEERFYRIQANLNSPVDLRDFPFDDQHLQIVLEDKTHGKDDLVYVPMEDQNGIDDRITFPGWNIKGWNASVRDHYYPIYNETYSQYVFDTNIGRIHFSSFMKTFLPVLFIMIVVLFSFVIDPAEINTKLAMVGSSLVAAVMFHVSIASELPPVGYLTFADKFMVLTYFILLYTFSVSILMLVFQQKKRDDIVDKIYRWTNYTVFFMVPLLYLLLFWMFL